MDDELQQTVESLLGPGVKVIDCEKKSCLREEEVLLVNGVPIALEGKDGAAIREALLNGTVPHCDLLNQILIRAGILRAPVRLETSLSVKSSVVTREEVTVARGGRVVDERSRQTQEDNFYESSTSEVWEPVGRTTSSNAGEVWEPLSTTSSNPPRVWERTNNSGSTPEVWEPLSDASSRATSTNRSTEEVWEEVPSRIVNEEVKKGSYGTDGFYVPSTAIDYSRIPSGETRKGEDVSAGKFVPLRGGAWSAGDEVDFSLMAGVKGVHINGGVKVTNGYVKVPGVQSTTSDPMIFDGVTSQHPMPDSMCRRSLPQTPQGNKDAVQYNGAAPAPAHEAARDADNALAYREGGNLVSGPLEALVQHMVPTSDYYPDRAYLFAFLLSSRLFIKPHELLGEVCALCDEQQRLGDPKHVAKDRLGRFVPHLVQLLAEWTETFPYDFRDERVMTHVRGITQKCVAVEPGVRRQVSTLLQNLLHRLTTLEAYEEFLARSEATATSRANTMDVTEVCTNSALLAQQLTHVELERLSYIGPEEFVQAFAKDSSANEPGHKDAKKTRNLESYVQWFNRLSYLVATQVCKNGKKKQRVKMVDFWIETARECFNIGNFNSLMSIIAGLNISPVSRLKKTWGKVSASKFAVLEHQMDPSSNFSSYRSTLKAAMWRSAGATDERQRIVIPFFSLLVKDLYFLNEGCSNKLPNGHINFEKFWQLAKQVTEFITWKQVTCPFEKNAAIITFLQTSPILSENALALASFECEAPDNSSEKERFKLLKAELNG